MNEQNQPKKFLILRFSSIGDIVLTSPVVRCIKTQFPNSEIHYFTKKQFASLVNNNPYIDKIWLLENSILDILSLLHKEKFDCIIDLHNNLRTFLIKAYLHNATIYQFKKLNVEKWLYVRFKKPMPNLHVVDRYMDTLIQLGIKNDGAGLDFFIDEQNHISIQSLPTTFQNGYVVLVIGAKFKTKQLPLNKMTELCAKISKPIVLIGGKEDEEMGNALIASLPNKTILNTAGKYNLQQSASIIQQSLYVIAHDTGMMHIAAVFKKKIYSIWGNTTPELGFSPYGIKDSIIIQNSNLSCRPCSKIGYNQCPKIHFKCMNDLQFETIEFQ